MAITINGSTGVSGVDGSSGTPAVIGSDADTGLYFAAGQVQASLNGIAANVALVSGTAQNSTSGTNIDFTGIPSWVKRVTVMLYNVSTSGTSLVQIQLGTSAGITTSGYLGCYAQGTGGAQFTSAFIISANNGATNVRHATATLCNITGNTWCFSSINSVSEQANTPTVGSGSVPLSSTLTQLRITTVNGTDTFDAGSINIMYE